MKSRTRDVAVWSSLLLGQVALWLGLMNFTWAGLGLLVNPDLFVPNWFGYCLAGAVLVPVGVSIAQRRIDKGSTYPRALVVTVWILALCLVIGARLLGPRTGF